MIEALYAVGLALLGRSWVPGFLTVGAVLVRLGRELDPDEERRGRMFDAVRALLDAQRARYEAARRARGLP